MTKYQDAKKTVLSFMVRRLIREISHQANKLQFIAANHLEVILLFDNEEFRFKRSFNFVRVPDNARNLGYADGIFLTVLAEEIMTAVFFGYKNTKGRAPNYDASGIIDAYGAYTLDYSTLRILSLSANKAVFLIDQEKIVYYRSVGHYDPEGLQQNCIRSFLRRSYGKTALALMDAADTGNELRTPKKRSQKSALTRLYGERQQRFPF